MQCLAVCCSVLQCLAVLFPGLYLCTHVSGVFQGVVVCCSVPQRVAMWYGVLHFDMWGALPFEAYVSVLQCVAVCCSVLQCVAVCSSVFQCVAVCFFGLIC